MKAFTHIPRLMAFGGACLLFSHCSSSVVAPPASAPPLAGVSSAPAAHAKPQLQKSRPGIGTGFGDEISSSTRTVSFQRDTTRPFSTTQMFYNDAEGIKAMAPRSQPSKRMLGTASGTIKWGLKSRGRLLPSRSSYRGRFITAKKGKTYSIVVENVCQARVEVVLSVDGLDVVDGESASVKKSGYIIEPGDTLEVKGFRTGTQSVAQFRFSSVASSYSALKHDTTRNVGVIGAAVFIEKGYKPKKWTTQDVRDRHAARAFSQAP